MTGTPTRGFVGVTARTSSTIRRSAGSSVGTTSELLSTCGGCHGKEHARAKQARRENDHSAHSLHQQPRVVPDRTYAATSPNRQDLLKVLPAESTVIYLSEPVLMLKAAGHRPRPAVLAAVELKGANWQRMTAFDSGRVQRYYDSNTRLLLTLGQGSAGTIHRAVWAVGVQNRDEALAHVDGLVRARVARMRESARAPLHVVDLGCGVCASLCELVQQVDVVGTGVTISRKQVAMAAERISAAGLAGKLSCVQGDFCSLPTGIATADVAYAIESFVHAASARSFFEQCSRLIRPGGKLIVCDDFLTDPRWATDTKSRRWIARFRKGWVIGSLLAPTELTALASEFGFEQTESIDLTPFLELGRPRDYGIALLMRTLGWLPIRGSYWSMLYGGHALQVALQRGYLSYLFTTWTRTERTGAQSP